MTLSATMPDKTLWDAPASRGAGGSGVGLGGKKPPQAEPPALLETGVKAGEEEGHPRGVGSVPSNGRVERVGDLAVTGTGLAESDPVRTSPRPVSSKRKKKERETIRVPIKQTDCPRWMHHRPGVYCKTCGKTP